MGQNNKAILFCLCVTTAVFGDASPLFYKTCSSANDSGLDDPAGDGSVRSGSHWELQWFHTREQGMHLAESSPSDTYWAPMLLGAGAL